MKAPVRKGEVDPSDRCRSGVVLPSRAGLRVFRGGWGDDALVHALRIEAEVPPPEPLVLTWEDEARDGDLLVRDATFPSPARHLPARSRRGHLRLIRPPGNVDRVVVAMAAWNDHGYRTRTDLATHLAERGIATAMLENPYYGQRRAWNDPPIRTVADFPN